MAKVLVLDQYVDFNTADDYIGGELRAKKLVTVYSSSSPTAKKVADVPAGQVVGIIYSWVGGKDGRPLYWMVDKVDMIAGSGSFFGFVKHEVGAFDTTQAAETSDMFQSELKKQIDQKVNTSDALSFLDDIPLALSRLTKLALSLVGVYIVIKCLGFFKK
jgi:hypothetical protein